MSRINIPSVEQSPTASRPLLDAVKKQLGVVPNLMKVIGNSPAALEGYLSLNGAVAKGKLNAQMRERIALAVLAAIDRRWPEFETHVQQALAHPNLDSRIYFDLTLAYNTAQLYEPATRMLELAIRYDPESVEIRRLAMMVSILSRDYDFTLKAAEDFRALNGNDNAYHVYRATALHFLDREMESIADLDAVGDDLNTEDVGFYPFYGYLFCRRGEVAKAEALALQQQLFNQASLMMGCRLGSGNLDSVFDFLEFMMQTGIVIPDLGEALDELRAAPRYAAIKAYLNLPEPY
ncbi:MAG: carboxymuconolactone decarboxylase family protein [Gammaproteobacteria bacterium]|nr:carboxymuconolactone decarboxylase family protein [Gammaproteobacteria bacterium]